MGDFDIYLGSLVGSWELLAAPHADAQVLRGPGFVASAFPSHPVFNNALLFEPAAVADVRSVYNGAGPFAIWSHQEAAAQALREAGFRPDERTRPMVCHLQGGRDAAAAPKATVLEVSAEQIALLNGVSADLLAGVPGARGFATEGLESGAALLVVGSDANVSFVMTRPEHRRRGLARAVVAAALEHARRLGLRTSSLQSTERAEGVYRSLGYRPVGQWQEWVPP